MYFQCWKCGETWGLGASPTCKCPEEEDMTQPNALFLADVLERSAQTHTQANAAAELRRLHAELERCKQVCAATSEAWRQEAALAEPVQQGCDHCNHPLYAAIKCRVCGRKTPIIEPEIKKDNKPVAWMMVNPKHPRLSKSLHWTPQTDWHITWESVPLYTVPTQRKPLTEEEALDIARTFGAQPWPPGSCVAFARAIEAKHGIL